MTASLLPLDVPLGAGPAGTLARGRASSVPVALRAHGARHASERAAARRRRRLLATAALLGAVVAAGHAGTALGGSSLATPERGPQVQVHVVEPGDTLWSIAERLAPGDDPRAVVDALVRARGGRTTLVPGETITWLG